MSLTSFRGFRRMAALGLVSAFALSSTAVAMFPPPFYNPPPVRVNGDPEPEPPNMPPPPVDTPPKTGKPLGRARIIGSLVVIGLYVLAAIFGPILLKYDSVATDLGARLKPPGSTLPSQAPSFLRYWMTSRATASAQMTSSRPHGRYSESPPRN